MNISGSISEVRQIVKEWRKEGLTVVLVPTMGYLHEGHKSLIERAVKENDRVLIQYENIKGYLDILLLSPCSKKGEADAQ